MGNHLAEKDDVQSLVTSCKQAAAVRQQMEKHSTLEDFVIPKNIAAVHGQDTASDELWEAWIRQYSGTVFHPSSTCRMGDVVDECCRLKGVNGLRIADASVMIGEKVAAMIAEDNSVALQ